MALPLPPPPNPSEPKRGDGEKRRGEAALRGEAVADEDAKKPAAVVRGDELYFVANSHWNRFDRENRLPEGLSGPIILKLSLVQD